MPYIIEMTGPALTRARVHFLEFSDRERAATFCRIRNRQEAYRGDLHFTFRHVSPSEAAQLPAPWWASDQQP